MHVVNLDKINILGFVKTALADGSARFIKYCEFKSTDELLSLKHWHGNSYQLNVNLPNERVVDIVINIVKTSINCYKVIYSDRSKTLLPSTFNNYDEINIYLANLIYLKPL